MSKWMVGVASEYSTEGELGDAADGKSGDVGISNGSDVSTTTGTLWQASATRSAAPVGASRVVTSRTPSWQDIVPPAVADATARAAWQIKASFMHAMVLTAAA